MLINLFSFIFIGSTTIGISNAGSNNGGSTTTVQAPGQAPNTAANLPVNFIQHAKSVPQPTTITMPSQQSMDSTYKSRRFTEKKSATMDSVAQASLPN